MKTPIHDFLVSYCAEKPVRCHMPGGKKTPFDITEIEGADSLFESDGIIKQSEMNAAGLFGAGKTLFSCGGSTLAVQTMLASVKALYPEKSRVAASRYCHKSLISSCVLLGLEIDWIKPEGFLSCNIDSEAVKEKINKDTLCVFIQSIDYYGGECDIEKISVVCKEKNVPLLTDNAHGAYLVFTGNHPLKRGADMTADSAHKTLPCLTGGAYLHISKNAPEELFGIGKNMMSLFGSSSPSYLILDSLDLCNDFISEEKEKAEIVFSEIQNLKSELKRAGYILKKSDMMRITIDACQYGYSGFELNKEFKKRHIVCEYCDSRYLVLLFSAAQPLSDFPKILKAALSIPEKTKKQCREAFFFIPPIALKPWEAVFSPYEIIPVEMAAKRICGGIICPCPPCVPLIMPGEVFTDDIVYALKSYGVNKVKAVK